MTADLSPRRRWTRRLGPLAACALAATTIAACGSDDDNDGGATTSGGASTTAQTGAETTPQGSASSRLALVAEESGGLRFDRRALEAQAGDVTVALDNPGRNQLPHAVEIEGEGVEEESGTIEPGSPPTEVTANLRPGTYTFYCPVGDHRQQGMEGTLTVR